MVLSPALKISVHSYRDFDFVLNSLEMTVYPTPEMIEKTVQAFRQLLSKGRPEILEVTRVIGIIISNLP